MRRLGEWHADIADPSTITRDPKDDYLVGSRSLPVRQPLTTGDDDLHVAKDLGVEVPTPRELQTCRLLTARAVGSRTSPPAWHR